MITRNLMVRFHKLKFSQKLAITKKLELVEPRQGELTDLDYFNEVLVRAMQQSKMLLLLTEVEAYENTSN